MTKSELGSTLSKARAKLRASRRQICRDSVLEQNDVDNFLSVAELSGRSFIPDRNIKELDCVLNNHPASRNLETHSTSSFLRIPRRPNWRELDGRSETLKSAEEQAFLTWRKDLARVELSDTFVLTPFERNIEIWRQLWRTVELSEIIVQVVDARNPLLYYCEDLQLYSKELDPEKVFVVLLNKSDFLTEIQRQKWAEYFTRLNVRFAFFSALQQDETPYSESLNLWSVLDTQSLIVFLRSLVTHDELPKVGFLGYPNVGKSSTINCLVGEKKVGVAATPGKTKHIQTLLLEGIMYICDCPGLVFPNFAHSKHELAINGILPIDHLKDHVTPVSLLFDRIPADVLSKVYGLGCAPLDTLEFLSSFATSRGFYTSSFGNPDISRASRIILKDFLQGKLLFAAPPPQEDPISFNEPCRHRMLEKARDKVQLKLSGTRSYHDECPIDERHIGYIIREPSNRMAKVADKSKKHYKKSK